MTFDIFKWFHDEITALRAAVARLEGHTAAPESVPVPKPAEVVGAFTPAPAAQAPSGFDWSKYAGQTDNVAFMAFVMSGRGNPQDSDKAAAYAAGVVKTEVPAPTGGTYDNTHAWSSFDGHGPIVDFKAGVPVSFSVTGTPAAQGFNFGWYEATVPCEMSVVAARGGHTIASAGVGSGDGNGNGGILAVPGGEGGVSLSVTAPVDTQRAVAIKP